MINSTANKQVRRVTNLVKKARARREEGLYVVEGLRMCRELSPEQVEITYPYGENDWTLRVEWGVTP